MKFTFLIPLLAVAALVRVAGAAAASAPAARTLAAPALSGVRDLGRAPAARVDFSVVLPYRHAADLPYLLRSQSTPGARYYRRFLTAAQFRGFFSPSQAMYAADAAALRSAGFTVGTFANRTVLHATGTAAAAERYFNTTIDAVRGSDGRLTYANVTRATIPAQLAGARVVGLNGIIAAKPVATPHGATLRANSFGGPLFGPDGGFGPLAIAKAEDYPVEHGYRGTNSNVADLIDGAVPDSDVAAFLTQFGIARGGPRTTKISVDGGCAVCADGFSAAIDAEWILGVAPDSSLFTYEIPSLANGYIVDGFNAIASDDAVNVVNFAVGACEINGGDLQLALEPILQQSAAEGITTETVAFGGANLCGLGLDLPMTPANLDSLTGVGASTAFIDLNGKLIAQSAFQNSNGGVSQTVSLPSWQSSTPGVNPAGRNVPDIVLPGSVDGVGPSIYYQGAWQGGFAFVNNAPFAGYLATVQQMYGYATPLGNIAPALYATFDTFGYKSGGIAYFSDIALGNIGVINNVPVSATTGYDVATGIGSIECGFALAKSFAFGPIAAP